MPRPIVFLCFGIALLAFDGAGRVLLADEQREMQATDTRQSTSDRLRQLLHDELSPTVMVVAHRGCWFDGTPENSLAAIARCIELEVDMVEIDVHLTADGVPVLLHDTTVDRTTDGAGAIAALTLEQLGDLRLRSGGGGPAATLTAAKIPTLREAVRLARGRILINLDIKAEAFEPAFQVVREAGVEDQVLMKMNALPESEKLSGAGFVGETLFMPIIRECGATTPADRCAPRLSQVVPRFGVYDPVAYEIIFTSFGYLREGVAAMRDNGGRIWVNSLQPHHAAGITDVQAVDDPDATWGRLVDMGVTMIQTDRPEALIAYLKGRGLR